MCCWIQFLLHCEIHTTVMNSNLRDSISDTTWGEIYPYIYISLKDQTFYGVFFSEPFPYIQVYNTSLATHLQFNFTDCKNVQINHDVTYLKSETDKRWRKSLCKNNLMIELG